MKPEFQCKIIPTKQFTLRAQKIWLICSGIHLEGFTRKRGKDTPNGIRVFIPQAIVGVRKTKPKKQKLSK